MNEAAPAIEVRDLTKRYGPEGGESSVLAARAALAIFSAVLFAVATMILRRRLD